MAFIDNNSSQSWIFSNSLITRNNTSGLKYVSVEITGNPVTTPGIFSGLFKQDKNYQFLTKVVGTTNVIGTGLHFKLSSPFQATDIVITESNIDASGGVLFYVYANPISTEQTNKIVQYGATEDFSTSGIESYKVNEIDMLINGYRPFQYLNLLIDDTTQPNGWCYNEPTQGVLGSYTWYNNGSLPPKYSLFGSGLPNSSGQEPLLYVNYIAKEIPYDVFNLELEFNINNSTDSINAYIVKRSDLKNGTYSWASSTPFLVLNQNQTYNYIDLKGTNEDGSKNLLVFSAPESNNNFSANLSNISIYGGYNNINNVQVTPTYSTTDLSVEINDAEYEFQSVTNGVTYSLSSKIGNGYFKAGVWENGVWNNGWRDDTIAKEFDDVYSSILYAFDISWKIKISGSTDACNSFKVGDKVSIGNIVAIDINENRKLIRDYYTISAIGSEGFGSTMVNWIEVSLDTTFPYRRIEKDSPNHKIKVTKNIWLSGAFFNGYFSGVWNNGLFKGYPKITEMFDTQWIDGFFNGGHFNSNYSNYYFSDIKGTDNCVVDNITLVFGTVSTSDFPNGIPTDYNYNNIPKISEHISVGDYVIIDKYTTLTSGVQVLYNESYNGIARVVAVNGDSIVVNKKRGTILIGAAESGKITKYMASGLIQNFKFYDTNRSIVKSSDSPLSTSVFSFNSWIDVNYDYTRSVSLGRDFKTYEPLTGKSTNRNNLYGYPTYDILSSASRFRNSFDLNYGLYKLGTKYKIFNDFIGDASAFNEPFSPIQGFDNFYLAGWTFSYVSDNITFNRSEALISTNNSSLVDVSIQDYLDAGVTGNELYVISKNTGGILNNNSVNIKKTRYSVIELDVVTYSVPSDSYNFTNQNPYNVIDSPSSTFTTPATQSLGSTIVPDAVTASYIYSLDKDSLIGGSFNFGDGFDGNVYSIDKQSDGSIIVAGLFTTYRGTAVNKICKINSDGTINQTFTDNLSTLPNLNNTNITGIKIIVTKNAIQFSSALQNGSNATTATIAADTISVMASYAGGIVVTNSDVTIKGRVFRINSDGSKDITFSSTSNYGVNGILNDMALDRRGYLYVVGNFDRIGVNTIYTGGIGKYCNKLMVIKPDGNQGGGSMFGFTNPFQFSDINDRPQSIDIIPSTSYVAGTLFYDDRIIIGGKIAKFGQSTPYADYSYDLGNGSSYPPTAANSYSTFNYYSLKGIISLKWATQTTYGNLRLVVDSTFLGMSPGSTTVYPTATKGFTLTSNSNVINRIKVDTTNQKIYIGGSFTAYNDGILHSSTNIIRLNYDGSFDSVFSTGTGFDNSVFDIDFSSDYSKVYIGGSFTKYKGIDCGRVVQLNSVGSLVNSVGLLDMDPTLLNSVNVRSLRLVNNNLIIGGNFEKYKNTIISSSVNQTTVTSTFTESASVIASDIINFSVSINLDCTPTIPALVPNTLGKVTINLKSPDGKVINIKDVNVGVGSKLVDTVFEYTSNVSLNTGTSPYTSTFGMSKVVPTGAVAPDGVNYLSDSTTLADLITTDTEGVWTIYIKTDDSFFPTLNSWSINIKYKQYTIDTSITVAPDINIPNLHFNNLNYEIALQSDGTKVYKKMSYLPITQNINHLGVTNTFRFDSVEKTSPERYNGYGTNTIKKKYEYFYNKTDLMMSIIGQGASQSTFVFDNIKMYETDMIPFFKYFEDVNIYKGIQVPYEGVAPNIDYLNSDFVFVDNITIGLDSINNTIIDNNVICAPNVVTIATASTVLTTTPVTIFTETSAIVGGSIVLFGNIQFSAGGVYVSSTEPIISDSTITNIVTVMNNIVATYPITQGQCGVALFSSPSNYINGLTNNTTYYVFTFVNYVSLLDATQTQITNYGPVVSFTTVATPPDYSNDYSGDYSQ